MGILRSSGFWAAICLVVLMALAISGGARAGSAAIAPALLVMALSAGSCLAVLTIVHTATRHPKGPIPSCSPEARRLIETTVVLADARRTLGALALAEAPKDLAWGILKCGCEAVIQAREAGAIRQELFARLVAQSDRASRVRQKLIVGIAAFGVVAVVSAFVTLVQSAGFAFGLAEPPDGLGWGLLAGVCGSFLLVMIGRTIVESMLRADEADINLGILAIDAVLALQQGLDGRAIRTLLERSAAKGIGTIDLPIRQDAIAA